MKLFNILFAFYMLFLAQLPCSDKEICDDSKAKKEIAHSDAEQDQDHEDSCTPFCSCRCCPSGVSLVFSDYSLGSQDFTAEVAKLSFYQDHISEFNHTIWQPPKI